MQEKLKATGGQYIELDWTNGNESITRFLNNYGMTAVPFVLVVNKDGVHTPLGGIPTKQQILDALD